MSQAFEAALAELDDYVRGAREDVEAYEEDLFARALAEDAPELGFRAGTAATLRDMNARGTLELWLTRRQVEDLRASNAHAVLFELDLANPKPPEIPPDAQLIITRVPVELAGVNRLEAEVIADDGRVLKRMPDIAFDAEENAIYACCEIELARTAAAAQRLTRLWATSDSGRRLLLEVRSL
ncbi:MAG: hypothetical protein ACOY0T_28100 [Myxococcota bacterium]